MICVVQDRVGGTGTGRWAVICCWSPLGSVTPGGVVAPGAATVGRASAMSRIASSASSRVRMGEAFAA